MKSKALVAVGMVLLIVLFVFVWIYFAWPLAIKVMTPGSDPLEMTQTVQAYSTQAAPLNQTATAISATNDAVSTAIAKP